CHGDTPKHSMSNLPDRTYLSYLPPHPSTLSTLSLHDALPILQSHRQARISPGLRIDAERARGAQAVGRDADREAALPPLAAAHRSEEHTSELQSPYDLVCRLLLEKKKIHRFTL